MRPEDSPVSLIRGYVRKGKITVRHTARVLTVAVLGRKKSGKTTIIEGLVEGLTKRGCRVAVLKHIHHDDFDVDVPGKDTWRAFRSGSVAVVGASSAKAFIETRGPIRLRDLVRAVEELTSPDIVLLEGFSGEIGELDDVRVISLGGREFSGKLLCECSGPDDGERALRAVMDLIEGCAGAAGAGSD